MIVFLVDYIYIVLEYLYELAQLIINSLKYVIKLEHNFIDNYIVIWFIHSIITRTGMDNLNSNVLETFGFILLKYLANPLG